jgi:hypothetical protein
MDLAGSDLEADVLVGDHPGEPLGDAFEPDCDFVVHRNFRCVLAGP